MSPKRKHKHGSRRLAHWLEYLVLRLLLATLGRLPWWLINALAHALALLHFYVLPFRRHMVLKNLKIALPELDHDGRRRVARRATYHTVLFVAELAKLRRASETQLVSAFTASTETLARMAALRTSGNGGVMVTGHFSNWEWMGPWVARQLGSLAVVYKPMHNPLTDTLLRELRENSGEQVISTRERAPRALIATLRAGKFLGILADQDARRNGEFIPFFGRLASTATGLATLAIKMNKPILVCLSVRTAPGRFNFELVGPFMPDPVADPAEETRRLMQTYHGALESIIRRHPEQYFWWHNRWKTRPPAAHVKA
jgi:KDO2-lipid IV(A) lauroyltransferase